MPVDNYEPLVEVTRGEIVESIHYGAFCVVNSAGRLLAHAGNAELVTYPRSSMKPFQVLHFVEGGGVAYFGLSGEEIAIMCGSHAGTALHTSVLEGLHKKIGITEADLECGVHWPYDLETRQAMKLAGQTPTQLNHNCSGKHTGMLGLAQMRGFPTQSYIDPHHPVQVNIRATLGEMFEMEPEEMRLGIDGCSVPVYGITMRKMAKAVAKMADPVGLGAKREAACRLITSAMATYPVMVAGPGQFDTDLMTAAGGKVFSKGGAEGYQVIGVTPDAITDGSPGIGIAIKISDGDVRGRARTSVALTILEKMGVLDPRENTLLEAYGNIPVKNWREFVVGQIQPAFSFPDITGLAA
jgi:L-asparaginase II